MTWHFSLKLSYIRIFSRWLTFCLFLLIANFSFSFSLLFGFLRVSISVISEHFRLNIYYEIFYFNLAVLMQLKNYGRREGVSSFLTVHINFQCKLKYHTSLFYRNFLFIFFNCFTHFFFICNFNVFFSLIFDYKFNEYV